MSLLSDTQGRPERVWSLLRLLDALGGRVARGAVDTWMMPPAVRAHDKSLSQVQQTVGCARSLGFVRDDGGDLVLAIDLPPSTDAFLDRLHDRLCDPPNREDELVLRAYACTLALTAGDGGSTKWLEQKVAVIAGRIDAVAGDDKTATRDFNSTKAPAWRSWLVALGLAVSGDALPYLQPSPAARLARVLPGIADRFGWGEEIAAADFVAAVAERLPYLDGGDLWIDACRRCGVRLPPRQLSNTLSEALSDLEDEGRLTLINRADAGEAWSLHPESTRRHNAFVGVTIERVGAR